MGTNTSTTQNMLHEYVIEKGLSNNNSILRHKKTGQMLLLRQSSVTSKNQLNQFMQKNYKRKGLIHEHYMTLQDVFEQTQGSFCSTIYKVIMLYQYGNHTLQHEIETRKNQGRLFEQKELWSILCSTVLALNFLKNHNIQYQTISPCDIFLDNQGIVKIPDPQIASGTFNGGFSLKSSNYFSPEGLYGKFNNMKSITFSLGVSMLQTMLMESMQVCYNYQQCKLDHKLLLSKIELLKQNEFSQSLINMIQTMIIVDVKKRPSLIDIEDTLFKLLRQQLQHPLQPLSHSCSGIVEKKEGDTVLENQILSNPLPPMSSQNEECIHFIVQSFEQIDQENPDDAQETTQAVLTQRTNKIIEDSSRSSKHQNIYQDNLDKSQDQHENIKSYNFSKKQQSQNILPLKESQKNQGLFTDPNLLEMLRKDIQQINLRKSKQFNSSMSNDFSTKAEIQILKQQTKDISYSQISNHFDIDSQLKYVSQQYARGRYQGQKKGTCRQGYGTFYYKEGGQYTGYWKNNKMHGKGTLYYSNNKIAYQGDWIEDRLWGYGTLYNQDPQPLISAYSYKSFDEVDQYWIKYQGQFVEDNKCGFGKLFLINDEIFQGSFQNDVVDGPGTFFTKDGKIVKGQWSQNRLVKQSK